MKINFKRIFFIALLWIANSAFSSEIVNFWSGSLLENSIIISFSTSSDADIKVQYSSKKNFGWGSLASKKVRTTKETNYYSKLKLSDLNPDTDYYYRFIVNGQINKSDDMNGHFKTLSDAPFSYKITIHICIASTINYYPKI